MPVLKISQNSPQAKTHILTESHGEEIVEGFHSFVSTFIPQHGKENQAKVSQRNLTPGILSLSTKW